MIGFYDYTVWLTYLSLISAVVGIGVSLHGQGHPYWGIFFLMLSGLCDAFDGRVARSKKDRTQTQKGFGIQIDSLTDLVAFGVLPASIGESMATLGPSIAGVTKITLKSAAANKLAAVLMYAILLFYALAAMIRLAYFNVSEEERQKTEGGSRKTYIGLPVTAAALIFPTILLIQYVLPFDITPLYYLSMLVTARLFISKIEVKKPDLRGILIMVGVGAVEALLLLIGMFVVRHIHY